MGGGDSIRKTASVVTIAMFVFGAQRAHGLGEASLLSASFLRTAPERPVTATSFSAGPKISRDGKVLRTRLDASAQLFAEFPDSLTIEAAEAAIGTSENVLGRHTLWLGRKRFEWSKVDTEWDAGIWSPRFIWDPLAPQSIGLTGFFYEASWKNVHWKTFATGVSPPERGIPIAVRDGEFVPRGPYWQPLPADLALPNRRIGVEYSLTEPSLSRAIFRPGVATQLRVGSETGPWTTVGYGLLPVHQFDFAVDGYLSPNGRFRADVKPMLWHHHLLSWEGGISDKSMHSWVSVTREIPLTENVPSFWIYQPLGPAWILGSGFKFHILEKGSLGVSGLAVFEDKTEPQGIFGVTLALPSRFIFDRAVKIRGGWRFSERWEAASQWTADLERRGRWIMGEVQYVPRADWRVSMGVDWIEYDRTDGWFAQVQGNDRVRTNVSYRF